MLYNALYYCDFFIVIQSVKEGYTLNRILRHSLSCFLCLSLFTVLLFGCAKKGIESTNTYSKDSYLLINEVMSSNSHYARTKSGEFYDWVELYNSTDEDIDLEGFYFSDSGTEPMKWQFPAVTIKAHSYLVVYMSELNAWDGVNEIHTNFKLSSSGENLILSHSSGDVLQQIQIPAIQQNVSYGRDSITGEFLWYSVPSPGEENTGGVADTADLKFPVYDIILNEYMIGNTYAFSDSEGKYYDWAELYNCSLNDIDLSGFYLTDDRYAVMRWAFPANTVIKAGDYLTVFCSGLNTVSPSGELHTSFSLSSDDDLLCLYTPQGILCSSLDIYPVAENTSSGISDNGEQLLFSRSTPGKENLTSSSPLTHVITANINDGVFISEVMSVSGPRATYSNDWIEIYNSTDNDVDLTGYGLSSKDDIVEFIFPQTVLKSHEYLLVYCTGTEQTKAGKALHTAFKLSNSGETLYLYNSLGRVVDVFDTGKHRSGVSSGRNENDPSQRLFFSKQTPGKANYVDGACTAYSAEPLFDTAAGYVKSGTSVTVTVPKDSYVVITKDGSTPASDGKAYYEDFTVNIKKSTVLKARAFSDGLVSSDVVTATYLVEKNHDIAVVSLSGNHNGLFSYGSGILVDGPGYQEEMPHYGANYWKDWERSIHIEYITVEGTKAVEFDCGVRTFGQYARGLPQKGLALILREQYGANEVSYPFFESNDVSSYKSLLLRPEGQDWNRAKLRDVLVPAILKNTYFTAVDYMDYTPVALYINGEYWGLYYLREKLNDNYISYKYGYEKGTFDLIKSQYMVRAGSSADYKALTNWLKKNKLTSKKNYEYFCSQVDIDSLIQFWIIQTFVSNNDTGNIRCYKAEDGKWRWMLYDFDWAFMIGYVNRDLIDLHMLDPEGHGATNNMNNIMTRRLLENDDFREKFCTEYIKALKYVLNYERTSSILTSLQSSIKSEIPRQYDRWKQPSTQLQQNQVNNIKRFLQKRPDAMKKQLKKHFGLSEKEFQKIWDSV